MAENYDWVTDEMFDAKLRQILIEDAEKFGTTHVLTIPGVYDVVKEHLNNDILDGLKSDREEQLEHERAEQERSERVDEAEAALAAYRVEAREILAAAPGAIKMCLKYEGTDWALPEGLCEDAERAWHAVMALLEHYHTDEERPIPYSGGGCGFYTPERWRDDGHRYGTESILVMVHDGGVLMEHCNMDVCWPDYKPWEMMNAMMDVVGLRWEACTNVYSAVYPNDD